MPAAESIDQRWNLNRGVLIGGALAVLLTTWLLPPLTVIVAATIGGIVLTLRWPVVGFALLGLAVPWADAFGWTIGPFPISYTDLLVAAITATWLAVSIERRRSPFVPSPWTPFVVLFLVVIIVSASQATDRGASIREIVKWVELAAVFLAGMALLKNRRDVQWIVAAVVVGGVSQALLGFIQAALQAGPQSFLIHGAFLRAYGTFNQPNPYAGYLNMTLPFALTMGFGGASPGFRGWYRLAAALIIGGILVSASRGAFLAAILASAVILGYLFRRFRIAIWLAAFVGALGGWLASYNLVPLGPFQRVVEAAGLSNVSFSNVTPATFSAVERAAHWVAGIRMFAAHPLLGVGIGNYGAAYPDYALKAWPNSLLHAHDYYINIAAEAGIFGLVAYLLVIGVALWYSYAILRRMRDPLYRATVLAVLGVLIATSFHNLFDVLYVHGTVALLGLVMALLPVSLRLTSQGPEPLSANAHQSFSER